MEMKHEDGRFYFEDNDKMIGEITYSNVKDGVVSIDHTYVDDNYRGQGLAGKLLNAMLDFSDLKGLKVVPVCEYAKAAFEKKPEIRFLLADNYQELLKGENQLNQDELKKAVGVKSVDYIKSNTVVGLGTGSTVYYMIEELGKRYQSGEIKNIVAVTTSSRSEKQAQSLGIPTKDLNDVDHIDLTIDGADQIDKNYQGIKGGGAAHLLEKMVATNSTKNIWIVDQSKMADTLGSFPLPLEVIPFGCEKTFEDLQKEDLRPEFRLDENGKRALTHNKNYVIDLKVGTINHPHLLADWLDHQVGIVAHGLFLDIVNTIIVGYEDGPKVIDNIR